MRSVLKRVDAVLVQAVIAGALSFAHLHEIAAAAGQDGWKAWAYPVSVDLLMVAAWRRLRSGERATGWFWFLVALAASLGANIGTAGLLDLDHVPAWLRIMVAGWPAVAFLGGTLLAHKPQSADHGHDQAANAEPAPVPEPEEHNDDQAVKAEPVPVPEHDDDQAVNVEPTPVPVPEHDDDQAVRAEPVPALVPVPEPSAPVPAAVPVPAGLVVHARRIADEHRARTGAPIDTNTLRARLGVPAPLAEAITAQLA